MISLKKELESAMAQTSSSRLKQSVLDPDRQLSQPEWAVPESLKQSLHSVLWNARFPGHAIHPPPKITIDQYCIKMLFLGDSGAGKSSVINSILNENHASTVGALTGCATDAVVPFSRRIKNNSIMLIDTPGLQEKDTFSLTSLRKITRFLSLSATVDIVLFCKRIDIYSNEPNEQKAISILTSHMGKDIWRRTVLVLTRAGFVPKRLADSSTLTHFDHRCSEVIVENFVLKKLELFQRRVRQETGFIIPLVTFVENLRARMRHDGQMVLPDGTAWVVNFLLAISKLVNTDPNPYRWDPLREKRLDPNRRGKWLIPILVILHLSFKFCLRIIIVEDNLSGNSDGPYDYSRIARNRESAAEASICDELYDAKKKTVLTVLNS
jgi:hypothetical protein